MEKDKTFSTYVIWGMASSGQEPQEYSFATQAELDAFLLGADDSSGWMEYESFDSFEDAEKSMKERRTKELE